MSVARDIDFTPLKAVIAEGIINQQGGELLRLAMESLIKQGASKEQIRRYILDELGLSTWTHIVRQFEVVYEYLAGEGG